MLGITALHHVAVCVTDVDRAKRFYREVLGLMELHRPAFPFGGAWYELGDGRQLHLIEYPEAQTLRRRTSIDGKDGHLAFRIADYDQALAQLQAYGVPCLDRPDNLTPWKQLYITDPDGNVIELNVAR